MTIINSVGPASNNGLIMAVRPEEADYVVAESAGWRVRLQILLFNVFPVSAFPVY